MIYIEIGRRERGKTTLGFHMARKMPKCVIIDARRMIKRDDCEYVHSIADLGPALAELIHDPVIRVLVYQPNDDDLDLAFVSFASAVKQTVIANANVPIAIMIDEVSFYNLNAPQFQWLAKCTPRDTVHLILTAHRPADVPTSVRAIADHWHIFSITQEHDLKVIEQRSGSPAVVKAIGRLRDRQYVHWNDALGEMTICDDSDSWFVSMRGEKPAPHVPAMSNAAERQPDFELE